MPKPSDIWEIDVREASRLAGYFGDPTARFDILVDRHSQFILNMNFINSQDEVSVGEVLDKVIEKHGCTPGVLLVKEESPLRRYNRLQRSVSFN